MKRVAIVTAVFSCVLAGCARYSPGIHWSHPPNPTIELELVDEAGATYDALLTLPDEPPIALAVLFGGGSVTDMHWTVPAAVEIDGHHVPLTTGGDTTDADSIARALIDRGIAVYQYSSIPRDQLPPGANPGMAPGIPYRDSRAIACAALTQAMAQPQTARLPVICIGHSLGAARALQCAPDDPRIAGFILLSGAYLSDLNGSPTALEQPMVDALRAAGADLDEGVFARKWRAALHAAPIELQTMSFAEINIDNDGAIRQWEAASALHCAMLDAGDRSFERESRELMGLGLPGDILIARAAPTLILYGNLDPMAYHGRMVARAARAADEDTWLTIEYLPNLGHNLGPVAPRTDGHEAVAGATLTGPIADGVCRRIADFAAEIAGR